MVEKKVGSELSTASLKSSGFKSSDEVAAEITEAAVSGGPRENPQCTICTYSLIIETN